MTPEEKCNQALRFTEDKLRKEIESLQREAEYKGKILSTVSLFQKCEWIDVCDFLPESGALVLMLRKIYDGDVPECDPWLFEAHIASYNSYGRDEWEDVDGNFICENDNSVRCWIPIPIIPGRYRLKPRKEADPC